MSGWAGGPGDLDDRQRAGIRRALARWRQHREAVEADTIDPGIPAADPAVRAAAGHVASTTPASEATASSGGPTVSVGQVPGLLDAELGDDGSGHFGGEATPPRGVAGALGDRSIGLDIEIVDVELLTPGRPGVLDVVAEMDGRLAHAVLGLRRPGDELHVVGTLDEPSLGMVEDRDGMAVLVDAVHDADAARLLLHAVAGSGIDHPPEPLGSTRQHPGEVVTLLRDDSEAVTLGVDRRFSLSVVPWLHPGPHPGMAVLAGLDEAGFNHLAAPMALWRRAGRDLGVVQEFLPGAAGGWSLALASLRDLFAAGVAPEAAGSDFAPESLALGTMTARMHLALDQAFGRRPGDPGVWAEEAERAVREGPDLDEAHRGAVEALRATDSHPPSIRAHGDFHLGRIARTDHGWVLVDCMPGGTEPGSDEPVYRSPLSDVADFLASLRRAAAAAATEQGAGSVSPGLRERAAAWATRNRQAFLASYLATPGIGGLVPANRDLVRAVLTCAEVVAAVRRPVAAGALG